MARIKKISGFGSSSSSMNPRMTRKMGASLPKFTTDMPESGKKTKGLFVSSSKKKRSSKLTY